MPQFFSEYKPLLRHLICFIFHNEYDDDDGNNDDNIDDDDDSDYGDDSDDNDNDDDDDDDDNDLHLQNRGRLGDGRSDESSGESPLVR